MEGAKVTLLFNNVPRMGRSNNLIETFSGNEEVVEEYIIGLTLIGRILMVFTISWLLVISILPCIRKAPGFLSGRRLHSTSLQWFTHTTSVRFVFVWAATAWIGTTIWCVRRGILGLHNTIHMIYETNMEVSQLGIEGAEIARNLTGLGEVVMGVRDVLVQDLKGSNDFCPALQEETGIDLASQRYETVQFLTQLSSLDIDEIQEGLTALESGTAQLDAVIHAVQQQQKWALVISIAWILVPIVFILGTLFAHKRKLSGFWERILNWLFLPVLVLQTIASAVFASALSMVAIANNDFCSPSASAAGGSIMSDLVGPQLSLMSLAQSLGLDENALKLLKYYTSDCRDGNLLEDIVQYSVRYIPDAFDSLSTLLQSILAVGIETIQTICSGTNGLRNLVDSITKMQVVLQNMTGVLKNALHTLDCESISPVINTTINDGVCYYTTMALAWAVICFSLITFNGLIMITLRSSFLQEDEEANKNNVMAVTKIDRLNNVEAMHNITPGTSVYHYDDDSDLKYDADVETMHNITPELVDDDSDREYDA